MRDSESYDEDEVGKELILKMEKIGRRRVATNYSTGQKSKSNLCDAEIGDFVQFNQTRFVNQGENLSNRYLGFVKPEGTRQNDVCIME